MTTAAERSHRACPGGSRLGVFLGGQAVSMVGDGLALLAVPLLVL
jgi:hypothetical protein